MSERAMADHRLWPATTRNLALLFATAASGRDEACLPSRLNSSCLWLFFGVPKTLEIFAVAEARFIPPTLLAQTDRVIEISLLLLQRVSPLLAQSGHRRALN
jgi:hypothetical protein